MNSGTAATQQHEDNPHRSRRRFLTGLLALASSGAAAGAVAFPAHILAKNTALALPANFVAGTLVRVSGTTLVISVPGYSPDQVTVSVTPATEICRRGCRNGGPLPQLGDRVEAGTYSGPAGARIANWVVANSLVSMGTITNISGNAVTIAPMSSLRGPARTFLVEAYSRTYLADGTLQQGTTRGLRVGAYAHATGTADTPDPRAPQGYALVIHQLQR